MTEYKMILEHVNRARIQLTKCQDELLKLDVQHDKGKRRAANADLETAYAVLSAMRALEADAREGVAK